MKKLFFVLLLCTIISKKIIAQTDSSHIRISLLTCSPGPDLYAVFGHTALRITDSVSHTDIVYNYGTFNFEEPNFYIKFVRGKLDYSLSDETLDQFMYEYVIEKRNVYEQELKLSAKQKKNIITFLQNNLAGNNRFYKYDFFYDNCTTRVKNILMQQAGLTLAKPFVPQGTSFRNMIHWYLDSNNMCWSKLGIDILLGSPTDKKVNVDESLFLPDYLLMAVDSSNQTANSLLTYKKILLNVNEPNNEANNKNYPLYLFTCISVFLLLASFSKNKIFQKTVNIANALLLYITGLLGCIILFMMFCTNHKACGANFNLLWAIPTNVIAAFGLFKKRAWLKKYFFITAIIYGATIALWYWLPQQFNMALLPLVILLFYNNIVLYKKQV